MKLTVLYGTETGNCKGIAEKVAKKGAKNGVEVEIIDLAGYGVDQLAALENPVLVVISTWDDGMPPPKCKGFVEALQASSADLSKIKYTVLALGDEDYRCSANAASRSIPSSANSARNASCRASISARTSWSITSAGPRTSGKPWPRFTASPPDPACRLPRRRTTTTTQILTNHERTQPKSTQDDGRERGSRIRRLPPQ